MTTVSGAVQDRTVGDALQEVLSQAFAGNGYVSTGRIALVAEALGLSSTEPLTNLRVLRPGEFVVREASRDEDGCVWEYGMVIVKDASESCECNTGPTAAVPAAFPHSRDCPRRVVVGPDLPHPDPRCDCARSAMAKPGPHVPGCPAVAGCPNPTEEGT
jgi:hypothetical protein